jgi:cytochrome c
MKRIIFISAAFAVSLAIAIIASCNSAEGNTEKSSDVKDKLAVIKRGEYLVNSIGCDDCHSPKRMGAHGPEVIPELRFSGYPSNRPIQKADTNALKKGWMLFGADLTSSVGPWGMSFSANISSDATGIGYWKEEQFIKAIREGKLTGLDDSRPMLPPMPWFVYKNLNDDDLKSIYAYLQSTKPVHNVVPTPKPLAAL